MTEGEPLIRWDWVAGHLDEIGQRLLEHVDVSYHLDDGHLTETDVPADRGDLEPWRAGP